MKRSIAPWDQPTLLEIADYQEHPNTVGYVCHDGSPLEVSPDADALVCPTCGARQTWVHGHVGNGSWRISASSREEQIAWLVDYWHEHDGVGRHLHEWLGLTPEEYDEFVRGSVLPDGYVAPRRWNMHPW